MTKLQEFKRTIRKYLYINDDTFVDVFFGTMFANRLDAKPVWLYFIGPPSCGKSELAAAVRPSCEAYVLTKLTTKALTSGFGTVGRQKDESLIPKLDGKVLMLTDFTAMLNMRYQELQEILGHLRQAYDGWSDVAMGTGTVRSKGKFGLVACTTEAIDRHMGVLADLGERCLSFRFPPVSPFEQAQRCKKAMDVDSMAQKEKEISDAALKVLEMRPEPAELRNYDKLKILRMAQFTAKARCRINRDRYTKELDIPQVELPTRLTEELSTLAVGIAMAREKSVVSEEEVRLVQTIGTHSAPRKRMDLVKSFLTYWPEYCTIEDVRDRLDYPFSRETVSRWLEECELLRLIEKKRVVEGSGEVDKWQLLDGEMLKEVL